MSDKTCSQEFVEACKPKAPIRTIKKLCAFTLAEVLITLAIIGVVAAITIPTVVKNYQKQALKVALKKTYTMIWQAYNQTEYELGGDTNCYYEKHTTAACKKFINTLISHLKVAKTCSNKALEKGCQPKYKNYTTLSYECLYHTETYFDKYNKSYVLADSQIVNVGPDFEYVFVVDTNGKAGPNKGGYDVFQFWFRKNQITKKVFLWELTGQCVQKYDSNALTDYKYIDKW